MTEILSYLALMAGIAMSLASLPQAYKIYKNKNSKNVSILTYAIFLIGSVIWLIYGINIKNFPIIITYGFGSVSAFFVLIGIIRYRNNNENF